MKNEICPYTCKPVSSLVASREHIVPDALGGANAFALSADRLKNAQYGDGVDSRLIHSPMVSLMATRHGVETRSGQATTRGRGTLLDDGSPVDATFSQEDVSFRLRSPMVHDEHGNLVAVRGFGDSAQKELKRVTRDFQKKGSTVVAGDPTPLQPQVKVRLVHNKDHIRQGLAKIAYLATVWTLGDVFTMTPAAALFRDYLDAEPLPSALQAIGLTVVPTLGLKDAMPHLPDLFHVISCSRKDYEVVTMVRLFNSDLMTATFVVQVPELGASQARTRVMAVNSVAKTLEEQDYSVA